MLSLELTLGLPDDACVFFEGRFAASPRIIVGIVAGNFPLNFVVGFL